MKWKTFTLRQFLESIKCFVIKSTHVKYLQKHKFSGPRILAHGNSPEISSEKGIVTKFCF